MTNVTTDLKLRDHYISHLDGHDIECMAMNLMRYCSAPFLERLKTHYEAKNVILTSEESLSGEFLALGHWISDMHCFNQEAFACEGQLTHELLIRQEGHRGMLELESVYSLSSFVGDNADNEITDIAAALLDTYYIDEDAKHKISNLGTGNEKSNYAALLTWVERQIVKRKLNNEHYRHNDLLIPYLNCITERDNEEDEEAQVVTDVTIH